MSRAGSQTFVYDRPPVIAAHRSIAGPKEGKGPLAAWFDTILEDDLLGQKSWELAESEMVRRCARDALDAAGLSAGAVDALLGGDLNNQIIATSFAAKKLGAPFIGLYGACSTFVEALALGASLISSGSLDSALCCASSHFCTAERQFRFPLELGTQRPPQASWTATACGCALLRSRGEGIRITAGTLGRVIDLNISDANHMGAARAPAVFDTLSAHLEDTRRTADDFDLIVTGDLGWIGRNLLLKLCARAGLDMPSGKLVDCGASLYCQEQDAHAGGSGCGCVASVTCGYVLRKIEEGAWERALVTASGALLSPTSSQQGQSIPGIAYAVALEADD